MISLAPHTRRHDIVFHASGRIDISARAARLLDLHPGDVIDVAAHGREWLIGVKLRAGAYHGAHCGAVYPSSRRHRGTWRAWHRALCLTALRLTDTTADILRCPCGEPVTVDSQTWITIIHRLPL